MSGATAILVDLGVRLVVFTAVFWIAARRHERIVLARSWVAPLVALVFGILDTAMFWALAPVLRLATFGAIGLAMPFILNTLLLVLTVRIFRSRAWFRIEGVFATLWMATLLTVTHGALWLALDYLPKHV